MSEKDLNEKHDGEASVEEPKPKQKRPKQPMDPVRKWTIITLVLVLLLLSWYLVSARVTPYTSQARVHALVVPIASEVAGTVISVDVKNNQLVKAGQILFQIEPVRYQLTVQTAEADLQTARQSLGASSANVIAAEASLVSTIANMVRAEKDAVRFQRIQDEDSGAISQRRIDSAVATLDVSRGQVETAKANVEKARQDLGESGEQNSRILQAQAALGQATLNLERTIIRAPEGGLVTYVRVSKGNYANVSTPQMTFIAVHNIWIQADFTENNLGNIEPSDKVQIVFDVLPGDIFSGSVRELGFGVAVDTAPLGSLPTINNNQGWLRAAQRYPVLVDFDHLSLLQEKSRLRVGSQASVVVFTGDNPLFNALARFQIWLNSIFTYAY